jgi:hypothetical protein
LRLRHDARREVDSDPADLATMNLHLCRVKSGSTFKPESSQTVADRDGTPDRAAGPVEPGQDAVAGVLDTLTLEAA